jgi:alkaline phosphatase
MAIPKRYTRPSNSGTHAGEDVALHAIGAGANRVSGVLEQEGIHSLIIDAYGWNDD